MIIAALAVMSFAACASDSSGTAATATASPAPVVSSVGPTASPVQLVDVAKGVAMAADPSVVVIDVRTPAEFAEGHIARAQVVDVSAADFPEQIAKFDPSATYLVYCHSGNRSGQATAIMATLGFSNVYDLDGGIIAWQGAGASLVTQ
jgi:rhodanese-related sulfurtransferase